MAADTTIMVVLICVGCALGLGGLAVLIYQASRLFKAARSAGVSSRAQMQEVVGRAQRMGPRLQEIEANQRVVAEKLSRFSATNRRSG
jgi:hypothetical protein